MSQPTEKRTGCSGGCGGGQPQDSRVSDALSKIRHKILVMSGKGGVGKSSVAANLAVCLAAKGFKVGLLDVDLHGPSIAGMMGIDGLLDITKENQVIPKSAHKGLKVVSMQSLMVDGDQAVIWRGPAKAGVIRQFVGDVQWGDLDFLLVDAPPGTGDEPLSVAQLVPDARALIVTTPQQVALADVRKSISFCRTINLSILGLVENMGPFACPCCGKTISPFKQGGGQATAEKAGITFMGTLPLDPRVVTAGDTGKPLALQPVTSGFKTAMEDLARRLTEKL